ncbi:MAG: DUF423 domain-containing protein [Pirellulales bacterium]
MAPGRWIFCGAILAGTAVLLGAYSAHGLAAQLERQGYVAIDLAGRVARYDTAVRYQMFQSLGLISVAILLIHAPSRTLQLAAWSLLLGVLIFSGLLYVLTFSGPAWKWLGAVVPIGGLLMAVGWFALAWASFTIDRGT